MNFWQRTHESILVCCKTTKPVFNRDAVREPYSDMYLKNAVGKTRKATKGRFSNGEKSTQYTAHENGALPRDVLKIPALAGGAGRNERVNHPSQKPLELCRRLIPFAGSGSECVACVQEQNVRFIAYEINPEYVALCHERINKS